MSIAFFLPAFAIEKDSNVVISSAYETYTFDYSKKDKEVKIKQQLTTTYLCQNFRTSIPIVEFYDDKSTIDDVRVYVDGSKAKYITPRYEYYSVENIFYSDAHICYFNMPLEKKGSNSETYFEKTVTDPRYFTSIYFSGEYDIQKKIVTITVPKWMKVELKEMNFEGYDITKTSVYNSKIDADEITYTIKNVPTKENEGHSPGISYTEPHLMVLSKYADTPDGKINYFNTLNDQYAWYRTLTKSPGNNEAVIKAKALEITSGIADDLEKVKKAFYWMHDNIRYVAFEDGIAGFKPEKADEVLRKKYGDCKGMAHLTKELLKALGFDARLCWIGTNHIAYTYATPSMAVDNHMICALIYQGKTYFLDATENYIGFNEYAERIQGREILIEDGDKYIYSKVPATTYHQNLDAEKCVLSINGNNLEGTVSREWKGEEKESIFSQLNAIKKEKSSEAFTKYLSDGSKDYLITDFVTSDLTNYDKPLSVKYNLQHVNAITSFGNELYVDIDYRKNLNAFIFDLKERSNDYWFSYKTNTVLDVQLTIPAGYTVSSMPTNVSVKNDDYEFTATLTKKDNKLLYTKNIIIKNIKLKKSKFEQWNKDVEKLKSFYGEQIVLIKK
ncbi:transglutaminase-like domain-containing protein [Ferruginibacter sp. SUN002]|uniref:transglutaminase-like domain-containing protein n=1 Tax=Ferruginibacter sp. SUN002 TaxID=2937789 RepID=UPI003D35C3ED